MLITNSGFYFQFWIQVNFSILQMIFQMLKAYKRLSFYNEMLNMDINDFGIHTFQQEL